MVGREGLGATVRAMYSVTKNLETQFLSRSGTDPSNLELQFHPRDLHLGSQQITEQVRVQVLTAEAPPLSGIEGNPKELPACYLRAGRKQLRLVWESDAAMLCHRRDGSPCRIPASRG